MQALDRDLPLYDVMSIDNALALSVWERRVFSTIFGTFAAITLTLSAIGLYGVMANAVAQRRREIGVRMALGARARQVGWAVTRRACMHVAIGLTVGLAGALAAGQLLESLLEDISPSDPMTLLSVAALLVVVAALACFVPARRAMRLDPAIALRSE